MAVSSLNICCLFNYNSNSQELFIVQHSHWYIMSLPNGQPSAYSSDCNPAQVNMPHLTPDNTGSYTNSRDGKDNKIKRPMNAFIVWSREMQNKFHYENPNTHISCTQLGTQWKGLTSEEKRPYIEEAERLMEAYYRKKYPNGKYKCKTKHQSLGRFPTNVPYHRPLMHRTQMIHDMNSQQAPSSSLWNTDQGQYSGMPATSKFYTGAHNSVGPIYSYENAPPMGATKGCYSSSTRPSYSYAPVNSWGTSGIPALSIPVNGYSNDITNSLPGAAATKENGLQYCNSTFSSQTASFDLSQGSYSVAPNTAHPINYRSSCSMLPAVSASTSSLDNAVGTYSPVGSVESYQSPMLEKNPEGVIKQDFDLTTMVDIYLGNPPAPIVSGVGLQNGHAADDFHKFSTATAATLAGINPEINSEQTALAPASTDSLLEDADSALPLNHLV